MRTFRRELSSFESADMKSAAMKYFESLAARKKILIIALLFDHNPSIFVKNTTSCPVFDSDLLF